MVGGCVFFALNIYDWKNLGKTPLAKERGCAGFYVRPLGGYPANASLGERPIIKIPNYDPLDAFAK